LQLPARLTWRAPSPTLPVSLIAPFAISAPRAAS
jgi:hypothetical protein